MGFWDIVGRILDYKEWAAESNYALHEVPLPDIHKEVPGYLDFFLDHHRSLYKDYSISEANAFLCEASGCYLVKEIHHYPTFRSFPYDEVFRIFSDKLNMLLRNYHKNNSYVGHNEYIRHISDDFSHALFDLSYFNAEVLEIDEPCIFIGSRPNYGHWFIDFLTKFYLIENFEHLRDVPMVFGKLKNFHMESLEILGVDQDKIIELPPFDVTGYTLYRFNKVFIPSDIPYRAGKTFLYKRFVKDISQEKRKRRLYLSRKNDGERRRVYNEEEVSFWLEKLGFEIVIPDVLSIKDTVELFSQAEMIVSSFGAQTANMVFTDNCPLILLISSSLMETREFHQARLLQDLFQVSDFIVPIIGIPVAGSADDRLSRFWLEELCVFRIEEIEWAISEAENFLKKNRNSPVCQRDNSADPTYINNLKQKVASYRQNPSADPALEAELRQERRKLAVIFLNTPKEEIRNIYQTYIGEAYNLLLSSGLQRNPPGPEDQPLLQKIIPGIQNNLTEYLLTTAYRPLVDHRLPLAGNERSVVTYILSVLEKDESPYLLQSILAGLLLLRIEVKLP
jgi:hypothetical protein